MPNQTIVAVYDTPAHAELAVNDLLQARVPESAIHRHTGTGSDTAGGTTRGKGDRGGFWSSLFGGDAGGDAAIYDQSMAAGATVVTVTGVPDHDYPTVLAILESHRPVDLDERSMQYGMSKTPRATAPVFPVASGSAVEPAAMIAPGLPSSLDQAPFDQAAATGLPVAGADDAMQLAEEALVIGKRLVNRGGTRVRRYVTETPVEQTISLRTEAVILTRHAVTDGRLATDLDFTDDTIEMVQTAEEAVVLKTARVVEEVALRKAAAEHVETIRDVVRKEKIEVQSFSGAMPPASSHPPAT